MKRIRDFFKRIIKLIGLEEMKILPGQLAFFMIFTIISTFIMIGYIGSGFITDRLVQIVDKNLPGAVSSILNDLVNTTNPGYNLILFFIISIFFASGGCGAMVLTSNVIYKIKPKGVVRRTIKSMFMMILLVILVMFIVIVPAFGDLILTAIKSKFPGRIIEDIILVYSYLKLPLSFILIFIDVKILYTLAPDATIPSMYMNRGALFTTIAMILITAGYSAYLNAINTYNIFYGSLANIVILLFWLYLLSYAFTLGIALNAEHYYECKQSVK